jgi:amidase
MGDPWGALLDEDFPPIAGADAGPLVGTTFVAKDLFDVAGFVVGADQPDLAATRPPATTNAPAVQRLLDAGATLVGRAHTSQMAYSLSGQDTPAGGPVNPAAPGFDTGGSSNGSAAAVRGGLADLGLGSDTLGSIRVPASHTGIYGWRPSHGLVPLDGVHPLAHSLDTVGVLALDGELLRTAAGVLAGTTFEDELPTRVLLAADAFDLLDAPLREALLAAAQSWEPGDSVDLAPHGHTLEELTMVVRDVQGPEFAEVHGDWIREAQPTFLPGVAERIAHALSVTPEAHAAATAVRDDLRAHLAAVLRPGDAVVVPLAGLAPAVGADSAAYAEARRLAASLSVVASLAGLPTVATPQLTVDDLPVGLGLLGLPGEDGRLLSLAARGRPPVRPATGPTAA